MSLCMVAPCSNSDSLKFRTDNNSCHHTKELICTSMPKGSTRCQTVSHISPTAKQTCKQARWFHLIIGSLHDVWTAGRIFLSGSSIGTCARIRENWTNKVSQAWLMCTWIQPRGDVHASECKAALGEETYLFQNCHTQTASAHFILWAAQ